MVPQRLEVLYGVMKGKRQKRLQGGQTDHAVGRHSSSEDLNELSGVQQFFCMNGNEPALGMHSSQRFGVGGITKIHLIKGKVVNRMQ